MDPNDLLYLHSTLSATIRAQQARIDEQQARIGRLEAELAAARPNPEE